MWQTCIFNLNEQYLETDSMRQYETVRDSMWQTDIKNNLIDYVGQTDRQTCKKNAWGSEGASERRNVI